MEIVTVANNAAPEVVFVSDSVVPDVVVVSASQGPPGQRGLQGEVGPSGVTRITQAEDVNTTELVNGALLIYRSDTATWVATNSLTNQIVECGQF